jgi:hypothetical protein
LARERYTKQLERTEETETDQRVGYSHNLASFPEVRSSSMITFPKWERIHALTCFEAFSRLHIWDHLGLGEVVFGL